MLEIYRIKAKLEVENKNFKGLYILVFKIGIDAFCTISLGKEKFVTAVVEKTTTPDWHEQCDMYDNREFFSIESELF